MKKPILHNFHLIYTEQHLLCYWDLWIKKANYFSFISNNHDLYSDILARQSVPKNMHP